MAIPVLDSTLSRKVITVSVAITLTAVAVGETAGTFYADGVSIGAATDAGSNNWTLSWTPSVVASSVSITFVGTVTGTSAAVIMTVTRAPTINQTMSTWSGNGQAQVASGITHPNGSGTVYQMNPFSAGTGTLWIAKTATTANAIANSGFEVWVSMPATCPLRCMQFNFSSGGGYWNYDTEETTAGDCYISVVERRTVNSLVWKRVQVQRTDLAPGGISSVMFIYPARSFATTSVTVTAGEVSTIRQYFCEPQMVGDVKLPFSDAMKLSWHKDDAASTALSVTNGEEWKYKHPFHDTETNMAGGAYPGGLTIRTIKPTGWTSTGNYPVIVFLPAISDAAEGSNSDAWETAKDATADYANTYGCVVCVPYDRGETYWWGERSDGRKGSKFLANVLMPWLISYMGVSPLRNDHMIAGYSKSGNAAVSQILLYPTIWGFAAAWDGAFLNNYPDNVSNSDFDSSGIYALFDPKQILAANVASVNDRKRLTISGKAVWGADFTSFKSSLTTEGVSFDTRDVTESTHAWGPTGVNGGWTPLMISTMIAQRTAAYNTGFSKSSMFFM